MQAGRSAFFCIRTERICFSAFKRQRSWIACLLPQGCPEGLGWTEKSSATLRYFFLPGLAQKGNPRGRRPIKSGKHIPMGLFIHKIKDYETTDYQSISKHAVTLVLVIGILMLTDKGYHAYRYDCNAPAHRRNHRISFQSSSTDCKDSIYLFHCRTPVFLTNKTNRYENKYMYIFCSCHAAVWPQSEHIRPVKRRLPEYS